MIPGRFACLSSLTMALKPLRASCCTFTCELEAVHELLAVASTLNKHAMIMENKNIAIIVSINVKPILFLIIPFVNIDNFVSFPRKRKSIVDNFLDSHFRGNDSLSR